MSSEKTYSLAMLKESDLYFLTEFFKTLGTPTRVRILLVLMEQDA